MGTYLMFILAVFTLFASVYADEATNIYLLRAPRSGSHWFFYCANTLFHKTIHTEAAQIPYRDNSYVNSGGGTIVTAHNPFDLHLNPDSHRNDLLIMLVRNYRECLLRHYDTAENVKNEILYQATFNHLAQDVDWVLSLRMNHFFHNLRVYDIWNQEKRLLVYYEDLLQTPQKVLLQVAEFIGATEKENEIQEFVDHLDEHMTKSLKIYEGPNLGYQSQTGGKSFLYHTYRVGLEKSRELDNLVLTFFPDFIEKYLSRYLLDPDL